MKYILSMTHVITRKFIITYYYKSVNSYGVIEVTPNKSEAKVFPSMEAAARTNEDIGGGLKIEEA